MSDSDIIKELGLKLIKDIGEDPEREGLQKTPQRYADTIRFLTQGYNQDLHEVTKNSVFESESRDMITIKDTEFYSLCEHHVVPFFGICHIGYIPNDKILGFSDFAKIIELFSRRLQIQERLTRQIASAIEEVLKPSGVGVVIKAKHLCMMMRGVEKQNSEIITSSMLGSFRKNISTRNEFLGLIGSNC